MVTHALYRYGRLIVHQPSLFAYSLFDQVSSLRKILFITVYWDWPSLVFLMKPSSIIFFIAFSCIKVLQLLLVNRNKQSIVKLTVVALFLLTGFASAYYSFQFLWKTNDYGNR